MQPNKVAKRNQTILNVILVAAMLVNTYWTSCHELRLGTLDRAVVSIARALARLIRDSEPAAPSIIETKPGNLVSR